MRTLRLLVRKDLLRRWRSPLGVILLTAFPLLISAVVGAAFGTQAQNVPRVRLLVEDRDGGLAGNLLLGALASDQAAEFLDVEAVEDGEGMPLMERGKASALLVLPEGFTMDFIEGRETALELVRNPAEGIMPEVAEQLATVLTDFLSAASRALRGPLDQVTPLVETPDQAPSDQTVADIAIAFNQVFTGVGDYIFPPAITLETVNLKDPDAPEEEDETSGFGVVFVFFLPGMSVYCLFLIGDMMMRDILAEGPLGTLRRQLSGPLRAGTLVAGKALAAAVVSGGSLVVLSAMGLIFTGGRVSLPGFLLLSLSLLTAITGLASVMYGLARSETQGATIASVLYLGMAFLGGTFFTLDQLPGFARFIAPFTPLYWASDGFRTLVRPGTGLEDVLLNAAVLAGIGAVLLPLGGFLLNRRVLRGAVS